MINAKSSVGFHLERSFQGPSRDFFLFFFDVFDFLSADFELTQAEDKFCCCFLPKLCCDLVAIEGAFIVGVSDVVAGGELGLDAFTGLKRNTGLLIH